MAGQSSVMFGQSWAGACVLGSPPAVIELYSTSCNPYQVLRATFYAKTAIFSVYWPLFGPPGAPFVTFQVWQMAETSMSGILNTIPTFFQPILEVEHVQHKETYCCL